MALLGSLTTDDGVLHSTAVAICAETNIHFINKHAKVTMNVYHSAAAFSGGKRQSNNTHTLLTKLL